ncbi:MAG TPA: DUF6454 family protein [Bryobacteraceae bacterium]|nr:DUF6454 family protein [Bryobacteraceae bacterium]
MLLLAAALTILETVSLHGPLHHVQGLDVEAGSVWVSSVDKEQKKGFLYRIDLQTGRTLAQVEVQDGDRFHPGGLMLDGENLWVPVAEYRRNSTSVIQLRDKRTLRLLRQFEVADHIGCIAASGKRLYGGNWDSREIYEWDKNGKRVGMQTNLTGTRYQDLKWVDDRLVGGGIRAKGKGAVDWLDPKDLRVTRRMEVETTDRGTVFTNEGMTIRGGHLYLLPEDDPSRLFVIKLP